MKRILSLVLAVIIILSVTGCGNKRIKSDVELPVSASRDLNDEQYYLGSVGSRRIAEGPDAFYYLAGGYLYYMDKNTLEANLLCSKPDCKHNQEADNERGNECRAYHNMPMSIFYYNNSIYIFELENDKLGRFVPTLNRYNLQGDFEKMITVLPESASVVLNHQGIVYYKESELDENADDNDFGEKYLMSYDLETGKENKIAQWSGTEYWTVTPVYIYNGNLYLMLWKITNPDTFELQTRCCIYNIESGEISYQDAHEPAYQEGIGHGTPFISEGKHLYHEYKEDISGMDFDYCRGLYMSETDGSNAHKVSDVKYANGAVFTFDDILLVSNNWEHGIPSASYPEKFAIYKDLELIGEFDLSSIKWKDGTDASQTMVMGYSEIGEYIGFTVMGMGNYGLIAVKKADLLQGKAEPFIVISPMEIAW